MIILSHSVTIYIYSMGCLLSAKLPWVSILNHGLMAWMRTYPHDISGRENAVKASES